MRPRRRDRGENALYWGFIIAAALLVAVLVYHTVTFLACEVRDGTLGFDGSCISNPERITP